MEKLKDFLSGNKRKFITVIGILMAIIFGAGAGIYLKNMSGEKAYHYENKMEAMLENIYGSLSLLRCQNRAGQEQLVMLKEGAP